MKTIKYMVSLLAFGALTGCSEDIEPVAPNGNEGSENGYINVAINLPAQESGSLRAADEGGKNDQFEDGTADEYAVKKVYLVLFSGDTEANAVYQSAYDLNLAFNEVDKYGQSQNITSRKSLVFPVNEKTDDNYLALAIINPNMDIRLDNGALYVNNTKIDHSNYHSILFEGTDASAFHKSENGFMMTNAPLATLAGNATTGTQKVTTLVPVSVYPNEDQAEKATANEIYVERTVAKVNVSYSSSLQKEDKGGKTLIAISGKNSAFTGDKAEMEGWYLNVTNKSTKLVRDVKGTGSTAAWETWANDEYKNTTTGNRFFGIANPFRVYWAIDTNYEPIEANWEQSFNIIDSQDLDPTLHKVSTATVIDAAYCLENTCNTSAMAKDKQVTSVIFKMKYYHDPEKADAETFYMIGDNQTTYSASDLITQVNGQLGTSSISGLALKSSVKGGFYKTKDDIKKVFINGTTELTDEQANLILTKVNQIKVYENGASYYYAANIKHFGDYYTPIEEADKTGNTVTYTEAKHLGRYGVVRNNWYELAIASVSGPGSPVKPDPETPDTEKYFVNVQVNILAWAKRKQDVNL